MIKKEVPKKRQLIGIVVSNKATKTLTVRIEQIKIDPKYHKRYKTTNKLKAHDEKKLYKIGDKVIIQECRPISKGKKWEVISKV